MWDGSAVPLDENLKIAADLLEQAAKARIVLEIEVGVVGGEEDGVAHEINEKLYTTPADYEATVDALGAGEKGRYLLAATFGNVHGVYKPGNVQLRPSVLKTGQETAVAKLGLAAGSKPFDLVFHGGSGSLLEEIHEALGYGVVKMNIDTDTQYAFTRPIVEHMFKNYDGVLKIDGEVGNKKVYDPRSYMKKAELGMAERVTAGLRGPAEHRDEPRRLTEPGVRAGWGRERACDRTEDTASREAFDRAQRTGSTMSLHGNLLGPEPTRLPVDPAVAELAAGADAVKVAAAHPTSSAAWATLAEAALDEGAPVAAYAYARTGYHRGLDQLRRAGWKGFGSVPWSHEPNRGFLRALGALHRAAAAIGELDEAERTATFLTDSDPAAPAALGLG